jgi:hypothetical protein
MFKVGDIVRIGNTKYLFNNPKYYDRWIIIDQAKGHRGHFTIQSLIDSEITYIFHENLVFDKNYLRKKKLKNLKR